MTAVLVELPTSNTGKVVDRHTHIHCIAISIHSGKLTKHMVILHHSIFSEQLLTTYTHKPFNSPLSGTTRVGQHQKGKTNLDFTEARDSEWQ